MNPGPSSPRPIAAINLADIRDAARRRLPRVLFDFIDGGSEGEATLRANTTQFDAWSLLPRQATAGAPVLATELGGTRLSMPIIVAPCGSARLVHPAGEVALAHAAAAAGTAYIVPHMGGTALEEVRRQAGGTLWYQLYMVGGRAIAEPAMERAAAAGYDVLVLTLDNGAPMRERDVRNGMAALIGNDRRAMARHLPQLLARPGWLSRYLRAGPVQLANALIDGKPMTLDQVMAANRVSGATFTWDDLGWIRRAWRGRLYVKSILTAEDARRAVDLGADGVIVSNHGGRGLDNAPVTMRVLPAIARAVGSRAEVLADGGVRRGGDVVKMIAAGAKGVLIGRPTMFALSYGEAGVTQLLDMLRDDLRRTLVAMGRPDIADIDASCLLGPAL